MIDKHRTAHGRSSYSTRKCRQRRRARRGATIVLVLGIIAITMGATYAVMRSQAVNRQLQQNGSSQSLARQAAHAGLAIGLRKIHQNDWAGVGTTLTGDLSATERYEVAYTTGDPNLTSTSTDYADYPYRVTLVATGYSTSTGQQGSASSHRTRAVVRLVPRQLSSQPSGWTEITSNTLTQFANGTAKFNVPAQIQGNVRLRGALTIGKEYDWDTTARRRYMSDAKANVDAGRPDYRPFTGTVSLPRASQNWTELGILENYLGNTTIDRSSSTLSGWNTSGALLTYRLYPGGQLYTVPTVNSTITGNLSPNPLTNPAGLIYCSGSVEVRDNAVVKGTIVSYDDINFTGKNVVIQPTDLRALDGTTEPVQLPSLIARDDIVFQSDSQATVTGVVSAYCTLQVNRGVSSTIVNLQGHVVTEHIEILERSNYDYSSLVWSLTYNYFLANLIPNILNPVVPIQQYPNYLATLGFDPAPKIEIRPPTTPARYQWLTDGGSIYAPHSADAGLRWDLVEWKDDI